MNKSGSICLALMITVGGPSFFLPPEIAGALIASIALLSFGFFIYFLIKNDLHHDIIGGILLSFLVMVLGVIPVIGWLVVICFVLYNIGRTLEGLKSLFPDVLASAVIYGTLVARFAFDIRDPIAIAALAGSYLVASILYSRSLNKLTTQNALFKMSVMWLSIPFAALTIISIVSALGNLFRTISTTITRTVVTPHMRAGTAIDAYTRNISQTVTSTVTQVAPGAGVVTAGLTGELAQKVRKEKV
ncbi:hypothetical protein J2T41_005285 [Pseudomonas citronellolis]|uniref:hypothetical protein n=1 Tax=Pseudomonas citronellolis TaxID=53408 RepID=UPI00209C73C5|nr:hypothetical protein [Pseudomonas citronellolis]MCP1645639.1 hypothetical protein [Pseudomonas citronellolis]MCP1667489.1 hypothetical protein [Pseudomonas citronellolis]MCP1699911.1 hypothetical protein [Pseudomonas citronellolis]MCP1705353.1 hypothetical protein [Pseudomonas citronellolis]MCP1800057.1 hypothetical protein [Pseudomonas citronellolis]